MTVLVAQHLKDTIILAADSGWFNSNSKVDKGCKIRQMNEQTFSSTGFISEMDLFECFCLTRKPENATSLGMVRFFCDFRKYLADVYGRADCQIQNNYFYVYNQRLFHFATAIREIKENDWWTDGVGSVEASMCMHLGLTPREAIKNTIDVNVWTSGGVQEIIIEK